MHDIFTQNRSAHSQIAQQLSIKAQALISQFLDYGLVEEAKELQQIENELISLISNRKEEHPTTHYIWHTQGDDKVRASHAANNGKIFAWNNPPATGHPGKDYNCRCWAENYNPMIKEVFSHHIISSVNDGPRWGWDEFFDHYFHGDGAAVTLSQIGHLQAIIDHAELKIVPKLRTQVAQKAREVVSGVIDDYFKNSYSFYGVSWAHGDSTVRGDFLGNVKKYGEFLIIELIVDYHFSDIFEDIFGTEPGTPYPIDGYWKARINAIIKENPDESKFP